MKAGPHFLVSMWLVAGFGEATGAADVAAEVRAVYPRSEALYRDLHQHPELSFHEQRTADALASELRQLGFEVTTGVGRTGVVGVLRNGAGPTVMLRTELDALPLTEDTGLPYASVVRAKDDAGVEVGVMHACAHDIHMAAWAGVARIMASDRSAWRGTLVLIGQPAEELAMGARAMLEDGLFTRFPRPDYALAIHADARSPSGIVGYRAGPVLANVDTVVITIFGRGGHGARPETTVDPVVIAARTVLTLQTIVSREISPFDPAVITVGAIHGGTRENIIPEEVQLQLTVRSFKPAVRQHLLDGIGRVAKAEAAAAAAPREPLVERRDGANAQVNDPALAQRVGAALVRELGPERAQEALPEMIAEDFSEYQAAGVATLMLRLGTVEPSRLEGARKSGEVLPSLHSARFAPDREATLSTAITAEVIALRELLRNGQP